MGEELSGKFSLLRAVKVGVLLKQRFSPFKICHVAMGKRSQLSIEEKTRILCWRAAGVTAKEMGERLGRNAMTIRRHIAAMKDLPSSATPPPAAARSGCPRVTSVPQDLRMKSYVQKNPFKTAKQLRKEVPGWGNVSVRTIQDRLKRELGLPARRAAHFGA